MLNNQQYLLSKQYQNQAGSYSICSTQIPTDLQSNRSFTQGIPFTYQSPQYLKNDPNVTQVQFFQNKIQLSPSYDCSSSIQKLDRNNYDDYEDNVNNLMQRDQKVCRNDLPRKIQLRNQKYKGVKVFIYKNKNDEQAQQCSKQNEKRQLIYDENQNNKQQPQENLPQFAKTQDGQDFIKYQTEIERISLYPSQVEIKSLKEFQQDLTQEIVIPDNKSIPINQCNVSIIQNQLIDSPISQDPNKISTNESNYQKFYEDLPFEIFDKRNNKIKKGIEKKKQNNQYSSPIISSSHNKIDLEEESIIQNNQQHSQVYLGYKEYEFTDQNQENQYTTIYFYIVKDKDKNIVHKQEITNQSYLKKEFFQYIFINLIQYLKDQSNKIYFFYSNSIYCKKVNQILNSTLNNQQIKKVSFDEAIKGSLSALYQSTNLKFIIHEINANNIYQEYLNAKNLNYRNIYHNNNYQQKQQQQPIQQENLCDFNELGLSCLFQNHTQKYLLQDFIQLFSRKEEVSSSNFFVHHSSKPLKSFKDLQSQKRYKNDKQKRKNKD